MAVNMCAVCELAQYKVPLWWKHFSPLPVKVESSNLADACPWGTLCTNNM